MGEQLPQPIVERLCSWMDKWEELDMSERRSDYESNPTDEELAIDNEGVELTKELKKLYGDKYRFRYAFAWRYFENCWIVV